ncbi:AraC-type DNA-binding protein [Cohaesibacter sp. ES.047]|uniref:helix-turn-helix domain-containing protein n=1 Tax=Cohaesibacter sp. ES.047 TaxID=1798205 RepID=UPI000BB6D829|nr:AraC family transcriptional regulator [Cohaesibacter sp. ES.047]SNY91201.1 AraC-type DNA-binding protein [Cohaesibacter sp. ES.047]
MIFVPLSFVVTLPLVILFVLMIWTNEEQPRNWPFLLLILLSAVQSMLIGLRFGYHVQWADVVAPLIASAMPVFVYRGALHFTGSVQKQNLVALMPHALPPAIMLVLLLVPLRQFIDATIILIFIIYAMLILYRVRRGPDELRLASLESAGSAHRALLYSAFVLIFSASLDTLISVNAIFYDAHWMALAATMGSISTLLFLSIAVAVASRSRAAPGSLRGSDDAAQEDENADFQDEEDARTMATIEILMTEKHIYRDLDLNLDRLARKAIIPSREISAAINRSTGKNVSQYVNDYRIAEACERFLTETAPVTTIMFDVGFQTKSNFNREFRRVTGMTPLQWRKARGWRAAGRLARRAGLRMD